jgi:DNA-directed RNA polymerase beta subunit
VFTNNKISTYSHVAEIRSVLENKFSVPKTTSLKLSAKPNQFGHYIRVNIHHIKHDIPLLVLFRALGIESDQQIVQYIVRPSDANYTRISNELVGSIEESNNVLCTREAREYLIRYMNINGHPKELMSNKQYKFSVLSNILEKEFLPHVGTDLDKKAMYLGFMVNKLLSCFLRIIPYDDRDSYINKRVDSPGILLASLFRQYYGKVVKDMRNMIQKDINTGSWKATNKFLNVINKVNINKIVKSTIIESGLKFGLATGNWGIKSSKTKQGVAQVLNRMTYSATISHLRRINTPIEKTGKLVQPRKLHGTQWGIVCPAETPEGVSVGLVKNLSVMSSITISSNSTFLRELLSDPELGVLIYSKGNIDILDKGAKVFVNGDLIGVHPEAVKLTQKIRDMKRRGIINVFTSVFWNIVKNEVWICAEGGRCVRPLYIVNDVKTQFTTKLVKDIFEGKVKWNDLVVGKSDYISEPMIEYMDVEECNSAMIAMKYQDLHKGFKGSMYPVVYTHLEMDPSMILGVLAGSIPFSDHNQAPRNTYQSAMGKQAIGLYTSNYRKRFDTMGHILNYPQVPLVQTRISKLINGDKLPCGMNVIVAIGTWTGFNQEDSIIMNKSSVDRGMFISTYYRTYKDQNTKNHSTGEEEYYCKPDPSNTKSLKPYNYQKLNMDGFVTENVAVETGDVIIGKCMPQKHGNVMLNKDSSIALKNNEQGFVDKNSFNDNLFTNINGDGYTFCKVRIRSDRVPTIGDKFSCYTADHEVLTTMGWVFIKDITETHEVASIVDNALVYQRPSMVMKYTYKDKDLYNIESNHVSLMVTPNHRMYVCPRFYKQSQKTTKGGFKIIKAEELMGKRVHYKKDVDEWTPAKYDGPELIYADGSNTPTHFCIPGVKSTLRTKINCEDDLTLGIDNWLVLFGIWIAEGCTNNTGVMISAHKSRVKVALDSCFASLGIRYMNATDGKDADNMRRVPDKHIAQYFEKYSVGATHKSLPTWVWYLTREQCRTLIHGMTLGDGHTMKNGTIRYDTSSTILADQFQRLCLHAGWACNKALKHEEGAEHVMTNGYVVKATAKGWRMTIIETQTTPEVNKYKNEKGQQQDKYIDSNTVPDHDGWVYCCTVPQGDGIIYVRRNGLVTWSGQSRMGQKGTVGMLYKQCDMPFSTSGIMPDIIINPHAIPSRMTIGQLMECIMGKACASLGTTGDATPFTDISIDDIAKALDICGLERHGNEVLYNSRTGELMDCDIFMGPTYYQRLKHMTVDKQHCLTADHDVLTTSGWIPIADVTKDHMVATLTSNGQLLYDHPTNTLAYTNFKGKMYHIKSDNIDLNVTANHRMWVSTLNTDQKWGDFNLQTTDQICGKTVRYQKNASIDTPSYQLILPEIGPVDMDAWLAFFGIWITDGYVYNDSDVETCQYDQVAREVIFYAITKLGFQFSVNNDNKIKISNTILYSILKPYSTDSSNKYIPEWVWELSQMQCQRLVDAMLLSNGTIVKQHSVYYTSSAKLANDFMRLCLHAGWSCNQHCMSNSLYKLKIIRSDNDNKPFVCHEQLPKNTQCLEETYEFDGPVYCLQVPSQVFYVKRNGIPVWTGNSRAQNGPVVMLTRQPAEGRARDGGLRLGEMEVECNWAHGTMQFLKERTMDNSDNYRVYICKKCGSMANVNPDKKIYQCVPCNNNTHFAEIRIPYACKLLFQEIQTMSIGTKFIT